MPRKAEKLADAKASHIPLVLPATCSVIERNGNPSMMIQEYERLMLPVRLAMKYRDSGLVAVTKAL